MRVVEGVARDNLESWISAQIVHQYPTDVGLKYRLVTSRDDAERTCVLLGDEPCLWPHNAKARYKMRGRKIFVFVVVTGHLKFSSYLVQSHAR